MQNNVITTAPAHLSRRILRDDVYDAVLELLLSNEFEPGSSLRIDSLARQLGVSPTPVREALAELEHTGLVHRAALRGYTVAPPLDAGQITELFEARKIIEVGSLRAVIPAPPDDLGRLREKHRQHEQASDAVLAAARDNANDISFAVSRGYFDSDWGFHLALLEMSSNSYLLQMAQSLAPHLHRMRQSAHRGPTDVHQAVREHQTILDAVVSGDADAAVEAMALHIDSVCARATEDASPATHSPH